MANIINKITDSLKALFFYSDGARETPIRRIITSDGFARWVPNTTIDFAGKVGEFYQNSAVQICHNAMMRAWTNSPCVVNELAEDGKYVIAPEHPLSAILKQPNDAYDGLTLWSATMLSLFFAIDGGNAYWGVNRRQMGGEIAEFVYIPHSMIEPKRYDGSASVKPDYYEFTENGKKLEIPYEDIIQFRIGIDPLNTLKGLNPLASALRAIYNDNEGEQVDATTLTNRGAAWLFVSPKDAESRFDDAKSLKEHIVAETTGDKRSGVIVLDGAANVQFPPTSQDMGRDETRRMSEARIAALIGFSPMWLGLAVGLEHSTYSNMEEATAGAWQTIQSYQSMLASQLTHQALRTPGNFPVEYLDARYVVGFDYSQVSALQPKLTEVWTRAKDAATAKLLTVNEARMIMGYEPLTPEQQAELLPEPQPVNNTDDAEDDNSDDALQQTKAAILARMAVEASAREQAFKNAGMIADDEDDDETKLTDWTDEDDD